MGEVVGTGEHLRRRTKRQSEKKRVSQNNEEKRLVNKEHECIMARVTKRKKPYADSSRGRTWE